MANSERGQCVTSDEKRPAPLAYEKVPFVLKTYFFSFLFIRCSLESCSMSSVGSFILSTPSVSTAILV